MKIFRMAEISRALTGNPRQIRADYKGKKYANQIQELREFEKKWIEKYSNETNKKKELD